MSKKLNVPFAFAILLLGFFSANLSQAQTATGATWDNTGTEWTNGTSWVGDNAPTNKSTTVGNVATFSNAAVGFNTVNLGTNQEIYGVLFTTGANAYTFTGSALTVQNVGGISNNSVNLQTFNNKVINNGGTAVYGSYAGGSLLFAGGIDLTTSGSSASRTVNLGGSGDITVSGAIASGGTSTGGNISVTSTGTTILSGNNTYFGTTTVGSGARLRLGSATALGATNGGTTISSGGALDLNGQTVGAEALTISGTGGSSSGAIFNSSASAASWSGSITPTADSTIKATNGSIGLSGGINLNGDAATSRILTLDGTGGIIVSGNISNSFAGSTGNIAIAAAARNVTLSGNNSYSGTTTLNGGGMNINSANAISTNTFTIGTSSFLNNTSGGAITNLGNNNITLAEGLTFGTSGSTAANSLNLGTGTVTASSGRTITIEGTGVTLGLGTLDSTSTSSARTFIANGAGNTLSLAGWKIQSGSSSNIVAKLEGTANWTITGPIVNGNAFSNGVQINATGLTTFGGNNTYDGATSISTNATLRITSATGLGSTNTGTTVDTGGQLQLSGGITVSAGEALSLSGGDGSRATLRNISGANTYNGAITFNNGTNRIDSDAGTLTLSSFANTLATNRSLLVGGAGNTIFTGRVTGNGTGSLVKDGSGTLTLANTNNEVGPTGFVLINNGTLALGTNNALSANRAVVVNGGTLDIGGYDNRVGAVSLTNGTIAGTTGVLTGTSYAVESGTISAILGGSGALTKANTGTVTLSNANTYDGATAVNSGVLNIQNGSALGSATAGTTVAAGAQLQLQGGITVNNEALTLTGGDSSTASLRNISGNNTYNGGITFSAGTGTNTIRIDSDSGLLTLSSFSNGLASTRALVVGGAGNTTFTGTLTGSSTNALTKDGAGTLTLAGTNSDIAGGVVVNSGQLTLATNNALGATRAVVINGGTLAISTFDNTVGAVTLTNGTIAGTTGVLTGTSYAVEGGTISARLGGGGALTKSGLGTVTLSGSNSYSGNTVIASAGVLKLESTNSLSKNSSLLGASGGANTGTLDLNAGGNYVANSYGTALTGGFNMNFTNSSGSAATLTFTNAENYLTIATSTSAGRSLNNQSSSLDITFDGNIEIGSATLSDKAIEFAGPGSFRVDGAVKNSGTAVRGLLKTGGGTLTLAGTGNNYNGTTAVDGGTLLLTNSATLTGSTALTVSTIGTVSSSSATRTAAATLNVAAGSTLLSNSITTVYSGGNLIINGTAGSVVVETNGLVGGSGTIGSVNLKSGAVLNPGNSPGLLTALSATWAAGSTYNWEINDADGTAGFNWDLFSVTGALDLSALNSSAKMNLVLNSLSLANFSTSSPDSWVIAQAGSFTGTGLAVGADLTSWFNINATAFNNGVGPNGGFKVEVGSSGDLRTLNLMAIPEPSTASMLGLGLGGLVVTRLLRRKSS